MLQLNDEKWETYLFSTDPIEARWHQNIQIGNQAISTTDMLEFLGGTYDKQLSIVRREAPRNNLLMRLAGADLGWSRGQRVSSTLYTRLHYGSLLEYAAPAWGPWISKTNRVKLERTQLKAARIMSEMLRSTPIEAVLQEAGLETVADRHDAAALCLYDRWRGLPGETTWERLPRGRWCRGRIRKAGGTGARMFWSPWWRCSGST